MDILELFADVPIAGTGELVQEAPHADTSGHKRVRDVEDHVAEGPCLEAKVQKKEENEGGATTWASRLRKAFEEHLQKRGQQKRPLTLLSACSGMSTHSLALKECHGSQGLAFKHFKKSLICVKTTPDSRPHPSFQKQVSADWLRKHT